MRAQRRLATLVVFAVLAGLPIAAPLVTHGLASLPDGFRDAEFATGFGGRLTTMTFAPDGRLFVTEKQGAVRIVKNGVLLAQLFLTIATYSESERGLKGIAFDPNYANNRRFYLYYTDPVTQLNKVSRFTTQASNPDLADPASELVLLDGIGSGLYHSGGALHFGPDDKLYVSTGDASYAPNGQNLGNLNGKVLRINTDGSVPTDNPFVGQAGRRPEIWAYGLRNPYTFDFDPLGGRLLINDVGYDTWEEINDGQLGKNYGWPTCEGVCNDARFVDPIFAYNHADGPGKSITGAAFYRGSMFPAEYAGDFFFGDYVGNYIKRFDASTGTVHDFATNAANPVDLDVGPDGALYYLSVEARKVNRISYGESGPPPPPPPPPNGNLMINGGFESTSGWPSPWKWRVRSPAQAGLTRDTQSVSSGQAAAHVEIGTASLDWHVQLLHPNVALTAGQTHTFNFAARASQARSIRMGFQRNTAPYPTYFSRNFAITTDWQSYSVSFVPSTSDGNALFNFNLGDATGGVWLDGVSLTVGGQSGQPPVAQINAPAPDSTFRAGDQIDYSGSASDAEDGQLSASQLTWQIDFHHDQHIHPYVEPYSGVPGGTFQTADTGESSANVWYRIHLTANDSDGNQAEVTRDVLPVTATVNLATQPAGLALLLDGSPISTPHSFSGLVNFQREIGAPASQTVGGIQYHFAGWSDGGAATHTIATPAGGATYVATYVADTTDTANGFLNPGFESSPPGWLTPWRFRVRQPAAASIARDTGPAAAGVASARIDIGAPSLDWHVQLLQPNISLSSGVEHTLTFWARASSARTIRVAFQRNSAPYPVYFQRSLTIGTEWQRYSVSFTPGQSDPAALFSFNLGSASGSVWLDEVGLAP